MRWGGGREWGGGHCTPHSTVSHQATGLRVGFITGQKTGSGRVLAHPLSPLSPSVGQSASLFQLSESAVSVTITAYYSFSPLTDDLPRACVYSLLIINARFQIGICKCRSS